jgi:hypothetical protein
MALITAEELQGGFRRIAMRGRVIGDPDEASRLLRRIRRRIAYHKNKAKELASVKAWSAQNRERRLRTQQEWREAHRARAREISRLANRKYREKHRERINARRRELDAIRGRRGK